MNRLLVSMLVTCCAMPAVAADPAAADSPVAKTADNADLQWGSCPPFIGEGCQIAVLHGDPSKPNADIFFKVPGGFTIPEHWHTSAERMVLVSGELKVTYKGQAPVTLKTGSYAYGPARMPHEATCAKGADCVLFIAFESPVDAHEGAAPP
jgi:quercetin dioxygenase-like cupin family protein